MLTRGKLRSKIMRDPIKGSYDYAVEVYKEIEKAAKEGKYIIGYKVDSIKKAGANVADVAAILRNLGYIVECSVDETVNVNGLIIKW